VAQAATLTNAVNLEQANTYYAKAFQSNTAVDLLASGYATNTVYINSTTDRLYLMYISLFATTSVTATLQVNGVTVQTFDHDATQGTTANIFFIVPPNETYEVVTTGALSSWFRQIM